MPAPLFLQSHVLPAFVCKVEGSQATGLTEAGLARWLKCHFKRFNKGLLHRMFVEADFKGWGELSVPHLVAAIDGVRSAPVLPPRALHRAQACLRSAKLCKSRAAFDVGYAGALPGGVQADSQSASITATGTSCSRSSWTCRRVSSQPRWRQPAAPPRPRAQSAWWRLGSEATGALSHPQRQGAPARGLLRSVQRLGARRAWRLGRTLPRPAQAGRWGVIVAGAPCNCHRDVAHRRVRVRIQATAARHRCCFGTRLHCVPYAACAQ